MKILFRFSRFHSVPVLCAALTLTDGLSGHLSAQTYTFQQNDNGQTVTNADGSQFTYPDNNLWTQPYTTGESVEGNNYTNALTNWTVLTSYPNGPGVTAIIDGSCHLNENVSFQSVTMGSAGSLAIDSGNSGGAGNHSIAVTMAAGGAGTVQNAGSIVIGAAQLTTTITLANNLTLSGSGTYSFTNPTNVIQGPGTLILSPEVTLTGNGGAAISASFANAGLLQSTGGGGLTLSPATATNTGTLAASGGASLTLLNVALDNTGGAITAADTTSYVFLDGATITGGTLTSVNDTGSDFSNGGYFRDDSPSTLNNVTLAAGSAFYVANPLTVMGTLTNNGYFFLAGFNGNTDLTGGFTLAADATLAGTGTARLAGGEIDATNNATLTVAAGATIYGGAGTINASLINNGTVASVYQTLTINSPTFTNNGLLSAAGDPGAESNATVSVSAGTNFTNFNAGDTAARRVLPQSRVASGQIKKQDAGGGTLTGGAYTVTDTGNGATLDLGGRSVAVNAAAVTLSGPNATFAALGALTDNQGTLSLLAQQIFSTAGALSNEGSIALDAGSTLQVNGNYTSSNTAKLAITVGGTASQGAGSPGVLSASGTVALGGALAVTLAPGAALPDASNSISFLSAGAGITGSFSNVPSGTRIATTDGRGSFLINYDANSNLVTGSSFAASGTSTTPAFFTRQTALNDGVYYLAFSNGNYFGYYSFLSNPAYLYHFDLGFEYVFDANDGNSGVYFYDFTSQDFFYTSPSFPFPYLYDFGLNSVLYYYPDPNNPGHYNTNGFRYFYDFATGQIITK